MPTLHSGRQIFPDGAKVRELEADSLVVGTVSVRESLSVAGTSNLIGDLTAGNLTTSGTALLNRMILSDYVFDDLTFPATRTKQGANNKPDFDYTTLGLLFPQNDTDEKVYISEQFRHRKVAGSPVYLHLHYIQDEAETPVFKVDYRFTANGEALDDFTTMSTADGDGPVFEYTSGSILQILPFPVTAGVDTNSSAVSTIFDFILYRDDNVVTGDVTLKSFDLHYAMDRLGSDELYSNLD
jgi:hypothetical protein